MSKVIVRNPKTGEERTVPSLDGNDLIRACGWQLVSRLAPDDPALNLSEAAAVQKIIDRGVQPPVGGDTDDETPAPANETLATMFDNVADDAEDGAEGDALIEDDTIGEGVSDAPAEPAAGAPQPVVKKRGRPPGTPRQF